MQRTDTISRLWRLLLAVTMATTSTALIGCTDADDELLPDADADTDELITVRYVAELPADSLTLTRTLAGQGTETDILYYALYNEDGTKVISSNIGGTPLQLRSNLTASVEFRVNPGKVYQLFFWAQSSKATCYSLNLASHTLSVDYTKMPVNDDTVDAFYFNAECEFHRGYPITTVTLRRPLTQIICCMYTDNIYDYPSYYPYPYQATIEHPAYTTMDLISGVASDLQTITYPKNYVTNNYCDEVPEPKTGSYSASDYTFVAFAYALADKTPLTTGISMRYAYQNFSGTQYTEKYHASALIRNARVTMRSEPVE